MKNQLPNKPPFEDMKKHLIEVGIWPAGEKSCSIYGILQDWINAQKWESQDLASLLEEINQALLEKGIPASYGVKKTFYSIVSHKLEANGWAFTFR